VILSGNLASGENLVFDCGSYTALVRVGDTFIFLRDMSSMTALSTVIGPDDITVKAEFVTNPKKYVGLTTASATSYSVLFLSGTPVAVNTASGFPSPASSTAPKVAVFVSDIVDNLSSTNAKVPLSAKQGKALSDAIGGKYTKPANGIPASDIEAGVIPSVPVTDVTVGGTSVVSSGTAAIPAIPDAVEANPTVPSGTTPTTLQNVKVGNSYYSVPSVSGKEDTANKVTSLSAQSTDTQYPSAKCVYDIIGDVETLINAL
jgi:hypothetical protein